MARNVNGRKNFSYQHTSVVVYVVVCWQHEATGRSVAGCQGYGAGGYRLPPFDFLEYKGFMYSSNNNITYK